MAVAQPAPTSSLLCAIPAHCCFAKKLFMVLFSAILARVDKGPPGTQCTAAKGGGPQYVSEKFYGKHDTTGGNTGDSWWEEEGSHPKQSTKQRAVV